MFTFLLVQSLGHHLCASIGREDIIAHVEALTKFTHQAFSENQQSPSLLNTEMSLSREAVLQLEWPWTLLLPRKEAPLPFSKQNVVCSYLTRRLMYHFIKSHEGTSKCPQ